mmetsp:Transcript_20602/g.78954  ORF Transcript_20602/g.78954 Transcript_20602/m.78954 type:complete len:326 (-) Transcript_20602:384-1361(-)
MVERLHRGTPALAQNRDDGHGLGVGVELLPDGSLLHLDHAQPVCTLCRGDGRGLGRRTPQEARGAGQFSHKGPRRLQRCLAPGPLLLVDGCRVGNPLLHPLQFLPANARYGGVCSLGGRLHAANELLHTGYVLLVHAPPRWFLFLSPTAKVLQCGGGGVAAALQRTQVLLDHLSCALGRSARIQQSIPLDVTPPDRLLHFTVLHRSDGQLPLCMGSLRSLKLLGLVHGSGSAPLLLFALLLTVAEVCHCGERLLQCSPGLAEGLLLLSIGSDARGLYLGRKHRPNLLAGVGRASLLVCRSLASALLHRRLLPSLLPSCIAAVQAL